MTWNEFWYRILQFLTLLQTAASVTFLGTKVMLLPLPIDAIAIFLQLMGLLATIAWAWWFHQMPKKWVAKAGLVAIVLGIALGLRL